MIDKDSHDSPRIGLVLSSGGVRGVYAHTGFLLSLHEMGIKVEAISGCSAGAVVGGIFASGTPIQAWANALATIKPNQFWKPAWFHLIRSFLFRQGRGWTGLSSTESAKEFCLEQLTVNTFEKCRIPFRSLAINIITGKKTIFSKGELASSMVASAAIPLLYQPVEIENEFYSDGALLDLAPTEAICCHFDLDILIIHHVAQRSYGENKFIQLLKRPWTMVEIINRLMYRQRPWYLSDEPVTLHRCPCGCSAIIIVLEPTLPLLEWPVTKHGDTVLHSARQQTSTFLAPYQDRLKGDSNASIKITSKLESAIQATGCQN